MGTCGRRKQRGGLFQIIALRKSENIVLHIGRKKEFYMLLFRTVAVCLVLSQTIPAEARTAFKSGEYSSGMTKQCIYDSLGSTYTRTGSATALCPLVIDVPDGAAAPQSRDNQSSTSYGVTAYKTGEYDSGMTKQCIYEALGSTYTKTVSSTSLCPLTVTVTR